MKMHVKTLVMVVLLLATAALIGVSVRLNRENERLNQHVNTLQNMIHEHDFRVAQTARDFVRINDRISYLNKEKIPYHIELGNQTGPYLWIVYPKKPGDIAGLREEYRPCQESRPYVLATY